MGDNAMISKTMRRLTPAALLAALATTAATPAYAVPVFPINLPPGEGCSFALRIDGVGGKLHTKEFKDRRGNLVRVLTAGKGVDLTYTNYGFDADDPVAGKSVTI